MGSKQQPEPVCVCVCVCVCVWCVTLKKQTVISAQLLAKVLAIAAAFVSPARETPTIPVSLLNRLVNVRFHPKSGHSAA
jgi:hypothetical protein